MLKFILIIQFQVGFDAGDSRNNEIYDLGDLVDGALDLPCASNVDPKDPPGFFIYKVSGSKVESPKCGKYCCSLVRAGFHGHCLS